MKWNSKGDFTMFKDLVIKNRSYRGWNPERRVTDEELRDMIDCARLSASSMNKQPLKFHPVNNPEEVLIVQNHVKLARALPELNLPFEGTEPPAYILILHDKTIHEDDCSMHFLKDVGITAQSITLCAAEKGLNCCMIGNYNKPALREALKLDERYTVQLVIAIGEGIEDIELVEICNGEDINYYRDEDNRHYVPKRKLEDVIV